MKKSRKGGRLIRIIMMVGLVLTWHTGCGNGTRYMGEKSDYTYPIGLAHIKGNLEFLASDALEGREAATRAERVAAAFIAAELAKYGILPFGDDSATYFQRVDLKLLRFDPQSSLCLIAENGDTLAVFRCDSDFAGSTRYYTGLDTTTGLVFAGYGIVADEYNHNDYRNLDVRGKIVLMLNGEPETEDSTYFAGKARTRYSSWMRKVQVAQDSGAAGVMMPSWSEETYGWQSVLDYVNKGSLNLLDAPDSTAVRRKRLPMISLRNRTVEQLFAYAPYSFSELNRMVADGEPVPAFEFDAMADAEWQFAPADTVPAWNVIGILPGSDPRLGDQHIVIGAHYDHVGIGLAGIYNGADDNASGTVGVLEVARALGNNRDNRRPVVFAFHTAEEKGLLGSKYLVRNYPGREKIMAHINLDMIGRGPADSIYSVGSDRISSELRTIVEKANAQTVKLHFNYRFDDPDDPERIYYRSDHYSYAREGIPTVFFYDNMQEDYHKTTDTADKINLKKVADMVELVYRISLELSNLPHKLEPDRLSK